jgi:hypothetical protein
MRKKEVIAQSSTGSTMGVGVLPSRELVGSKQGALLLFLFCYKTRFMEDVGRILKGTAL